MHKNTKQTGETSYVEENQNGLDKVLTKDTCWERERKMLLSLLCLTFLSLELPTVVIPEGSPLLVVAVAGTETSCCHLNQCIL